MKKNLTFILLITIFLFTNCKNEKPGFLHAEGQNIVDAQGKNVVLRGVGLGGWMLQEGYMLQTAGFAGTQYKIKEHIAHVAGTEGMEAFYEAWLANYCTKADVDSMAAWGFNSIRLPMHYNLFTLAIENEPVEGEDTWLNQGFEMVDNLLEWCGDNQMYLILDLHAAPGGQGKNADISDYNPDKPSLWESPENQRKTIALWRNLAERYANEPWIGGFDLINEPNWDFENSDNENGCNCNQNEQLWSLFHNITKAIRQINQNHIIFLGGNCWGNNYKGIPNFTQWDNNIAISFHKYWNFNNQESIQWVVDMREEYKVPIWLGESGENSNTWFSNAIRLIESNNIGWAWWPYKKIESSSSQVTASKTQGYQNLLNFWKEKGVRPNPEQAKTWLLEQAEMLKLENCKINYDLLDAMLRQPQGDKSAIPFKNHHIPGTIFAVDYDLGANNFAYFDTDTANYRTSTNKNTSWNRGGKYRNDGVDISICNDKKTNGYCVTSTHQGEWLLYTVDVETADKYHFETRYAAGLTPASFHFEVNNEVYPKINILPKTAELDEWNTISSSNIELKKGKNQIILRIDEGDFSINFFNVTSK
ncbi:MAG TPA: cellulase family glycosylhydrolase [Prolixibacteraceae bacterium]|nr:cellulase family glycosylhydrolase [Prolixibacteraceae bacterium]